MVREIHSLPGRVRLHLTGWSGEGRSSIERSVGGLAGVRLASANSRTRNLLVQFDPSAVTAAEIRDAAERAVHECGSDGAIADSKYRAAFQVACYGIVAHVAVDVVFYTVAFAGPFGLVGHALGATHLAIDAFIWMATLASALWLLVRKPGAAAVTP